MTLGEVQAAIYRTECGALLLDGQFCSQPVLSQGPKGLVDNFFTYSINKETGEVSRPLAVFGIYAETGEAAGIDRSPACPAPPRELNGAAEQANQYDLFTRYQALYPSVRALAFRQCTPQDAAAVREYCTLLKKLSLPGVWALYRKLFPAFFDWAAKLQ